jgi:prophage antirepressor-like protein/transcriptional regulator with XRE-family HTH domain
MNFKQYRIDRNLTQDQAADLIGMSGSYWSTLEAGQQPEAKAKAFARVLKYLDHPNIDKPLTAKSMHVLIYGLNYKDASALIGAGDSTWSSLANGHLPAKRRWTRSVNALLIELAESKRPALDLTPGGEIEIVQPVLTPADESPVVEEEISDQPGLIPFAYGSQKVRVKWINEEPWFMLSDVCRAIGYKSIQHAISLIRERDIQKVEVIDSMGRAQFANFVSERGMSQFFLRARVPAVEPFQDWVFDEVLPSIRKTGGYQAQSVQINDPLSQAIMIGQALQTFGKEIQAMYYNKNINICY